MSIEIQGVGKKFGDFVALENIDLSIPTGQLTALLGPSGGGKSTLLRIIAGLDTADAGTVVIEGKDTTGVPAQKRNVGFVFQHYAAFRHLSVYKNVAFGLEIRKRPKSEIRKRVFELLELVHLENFADRLPSQLSGGQRQRMALARALAVQPQVLLLDEPSMGLAPVLVEAIFDIIVQINREGKTVLLVEQNALMALEVAHRGYVLQTGEVVLTDSAKSLLENDLVRKAYLGEA